MRNEWKQQKPKDIRAKEPMECEACHLTIEIGQIFVKHHVTYFPEKIVKVHGRCHGLIHRSKTFYHDLKPNPAQAKRWYSKKGSTYSNYPIYAHDYKFVVFMDCIENGFMTDERIEKISIEKLMQWENKQDRIDEIRKRLDIRQEWDSADLITPSFPV